MLTNTGLRSNLLIVTSSGVCLVNNIGSYMFQTIVSETKDYVIW
jgi:hypothetical protein